MKQYTTKTQSNDSGASISQSASEGKHETLSASIVCPALLDEADGELSLNSKFIEQINLAINPPKPLCASDVHVRAMLLVSDERNQHGGKFPLEELQKITELVIDSPVLVGHRKDCLPIARVFQAEMTTQGGRNWVKAYLYWLRETSGSETLRANIDGGVYKDCSLGFTFSRAECSVCGADIRTCGHQSPSFSNEIEADAPFHYYRNVQQALEISLVYRGANSGARVGVELDYESGAADTTASAPNEKTAWLANLNVVRIGDLANCNHITDATKGQSDSNTTTQSYPLIDGLPLLVGRHNSETVVLLDDGSPAPKDLRAIVNELCDFQDCNSQAVDFLFYARLVGMRGKNKRSCNELLRYLAGGSGPVRTLRLRPLSLLRLDDQWLSMQNATRFRDVLYQICSSKQKLCAVRRSSEQGHDSALTHSSLDTETISLTGNAQIRLVRRRQRPMINASVSCSASKELTVSVPIIGDPQETSAIETLSIPLERPKGHFVDEIVALAFDQLLQTSATPRLINPRIVGRLGSYGTSEILQDTVANSTSTSSCVRAQFPNFSQTSLGVVQLAKPAGASINSSELIAGLLVSRESEDNSPLSARIIHLKSESRNLLGLLATSPKSVGAGH